MLGGDLSFGFPDLQGRDNKLFEAQTRCLEKGRKAEEKTRRKEKQDRKAQLNF